MSESYPSFTIKDVADKLGVGESTLNVWRNRYSEWILGVGDHDQKLFSAEELDLFRFISECTDAGMDTWEIKDALTSMGGTVVNDDISGEESKDEHIEPQEVNAEKKESKFQIDSDLLNPFKSMVTDIVNQQTRIADAQERRATAEERKAYALESRAEAELLKANVMRDIVTALQDISVKSTVDSLIDRVKNMPGPSIGDLQELSEDFGLRFTELEELPELTEVADVDSSADEMPEASDIEANSDKTSHVPDQPTEKVIEEFETPDELDTVQVDEATQVNDAVQPDEGTQADDVDDLSQLIDETELKFDADVDDLSKLLDQELPRQAEGEDVDDLSNLLDEEPVETAIDIDDLSMLLDGGAEKTIHGDSNIDDLSALLDEQVVPEAQVEIDDLSALLDVAPPEPAEATGEKKSVEELPPSEKPPVDPDYKSQILKRIINMKQKEGLSVEDATKQFNDEGVKTLSGKGQWDKKTIAGIYKYIDSVQAPS